MLFPSGLDWSVLEFAVPAVAFVALYSFLPHKELRFLLPALPLFHLMAGSGLAKVWGIARALAQSHADSRAEVINAEEQTAQQTAPSPLSDSGLPRHRRAERSTLAHPAGNALPAPRPTRSILRYAIGAALAVGIAGALTASALGTVLFVRISMDNYPGGAGLQRLYSLHDATECRSDVVAAGVSELWRVCLASSGDACGSALRVVAAAPLPRCTSTRWPRSLAVHVDVAAAVSGVSRFAESWSGAWAVSKVENMSPAMVARAFDWIITEDPTMHAAVFEVIEAVPAFSRIDWRSGAIVERKPVLFIMRRRP